MVSHQVLDITINAWSGGVQVYSEIRQCIQGNIAQIIHRLGDEILDSDWREFDAEAMRLVNMMPKWKPGSIDGVKVKNRVMVYIYYKDLEKSCFVFDSYVWK